MKVALRVFARFTGTHEMVETIILSRYLNPNTTVYILTLYFW